MISFYSGDVDDLSAALLDECSLDRDGFSHFFDEHIFARLMVLDSHHHVNFALLRHHADGIPCFGARNRALFVFGSVVASFEVTPEVNDFAFDRDGITFGLATPAIVIRPGTTQRSRIKGFMASTLTSSAGIAS